MRRSGFRQNASVRCVVLKAAALLFCGCTFDAGKLNEPYTAGSGVTIEEGEISVDTSGLLREPQECAPDDFLQRNSLGDGWECAAAVPGEGDITSVLAGEGLTGGGTEGDVTLSVAFEGSGSAATAARSDHAHSWSELSGLPAGFADGTDDVGEYSAGSGLVLSGGEFSLDDTGCEAGYMLKRNSSNDGWECYWDRVLTESEVDSFVANNGYASEAGLVVHRTSSDHDVRYYTEGEVDALVSALQARLEALEDDSCPRGYVHDTSRTDIVLCKSGLDEMVKVGDFWIDRYEGVIVDEAYWNGGSCDGVGNLYGSTSDNWGSVVGTFPFTGNFSVKLYACSKSGVTPSRWMTWFQAQQALSASGKHLCTNGEWQAAVAGTVDPGVFDGSGGGACHTSGSSPRQTGNAGLTPGAGNSCISRWGAEEMIGNLWEWVDFWGQAGPDSGVAAGAYAGNVTANSGWAGFSPETSGDGDGTWNLAGTAYGCDRNGGVCGWKTGLPFAALRGGYWDNGAPAGALALHLSDAPSYRSDSVGLRGCRR